MPENSQEPSDQSWNPGAFNGGGDCHESCFSHRGQFAGYSGPELRQGYSGSGSDLCLNDGRH